MRGSECGWRSVAYKMLCSIRPRCTSVDAAVSLNSVYVVSQERRERLPNVFTPMQQTYKAKLPFPSRSLSIFLSSQRYIISGSRRPSVQIFCNIFSTYFVSRYSCTVSVEERKKLVWFICYLMMAQHLKPNTHRRRRRNSTVELSCVGVGGVYWVLLELRQIRKLLIVLYTHCRSCKFSRPHHYKFAVVY